MRAFISYSHHDAHALDRLRVHLAALRNEGMIEDWNDHEILAGASFDASISQELETVGLFLLLMSPDFIASDYCMNKEMKRALERHAAGEARVVPIIIEPCEWKSIEPIRSLKALPQDGKPVSEWANINTAYLNIAQEIRRIIDEENRSASNGVVNAVDKSSEKNPRYRVKKTFDDIDRSDFREEAFSRIKMYFSRAIEEIEQIDGLKGRFFDSGSASFNCTIVNRALRQGAAHISVHRKSGSAMQHGDISFSFQENAPSSTSNGIFSVNADDYEQFLSGGMFGFGIGHTGKSDRLTPEQAAEQIWNQFLEQAGISYA